MKAKSRWRASIPTGRQIRFSVVKQLERAAPGICMQMGLITREADFASLATRGPLTKVESSETSFPPDWIQRFGASFQSEHRREGHVPIASELELQFALFEDVVVFGHTGQIVDVGTSRSIAPAHRGSTKPGLLFTQWLDGVAFSLLTGVPGKRRNYFHYLTEVLPEHLFALRSAIDTFGQLTLLLPTSDHPLDVALVSEARRLYPHLPVRRLRRSERLRCEAVVFHRVRRSSMFRSPASRRLLSITVEALRNSFQVLPGIPGSMPNVAKRRLFISRADAKRPRLLNEDEVFKRIEALGFERVIPGRLSIADQIALFSEAQIVAGAHGAGLTNLIFMPGGGAVVENFHPSLVHGAYAWLSHLAGQMYGHSVSDGSTANWVDFEYRLMGGPLDAFEQEVEKSLERIAANRLPGSHLGS